jgi:hypothetical protein
MLVGVGIEPLARGSDGLGSSESVDYLLVEDLLKSHHSN